MTTKRIDGFDPGHPVPDGAIRFALNGTTVVEDTVEAHTWYWAYTPSASDVYLKFGTATVAAIDRTKNMLLAPGLYVPVYSADAISAGVACDATAAGYAWLIKIGGDDALS